MRTHVFGTLVTALSVPFLTGQSCIPPGSSWVPLPGPTEGAERLDARYGDGVLLLGDRSVWEVSYGIVTSWYSGDEVLVEGNRITNLDRDVDVTGVYLGRSRTFSSIIAVSNGGLEVSLANGSVWYIHPEDAVKSAFWLSGTRVLVVTGTSRDYLVNTRTGDAVAAL